MEKIIENIKNFKENNEILDDNWIDIYIIVKKIKEELNECEIKEMNWNNFKINYKNENYLIERIAYPNGSSKYLIKKI